MFPHSFKRDRWLLGQLATLVLAICTLSIQAGYKDDIGYTALLNELGAGTPNGVGIKVTQAEASTGTSSSESITYYHYLPTTSAYAGVIFSNPSNGAYPGAVSGHADMVGQLIYGDSSMGFGIDRVTNYEANNWINSGFLNSQSPSSAPKVENNDVQNHSWVGSSDGAQVILSRLDFAIERDDFVSVVGVNNGANADRPLLSAAYNVISVGITTGNHSSTPTAAVQRPHIVAPAGTTSEATAIVSSAATLLIQQARTAYGDGSPAERSETIKAIMLAGATKTEFQNWSRTNTMPLDSVYGAGELNVYNNYHIMEGGEQSASATPEALVAATGWDYGSITASQTVSYYFDLASDSDISIALTWNAKYTVSGNDYNNLQLSLANLNLYFYLVGENNQLTLVQQSISGTENLEYIWTMGLAPGTYVIQVTSASGSTDYALAWQSGDTLGAIPEPSTVVLLVIGAAFAFIFFRRRGRV